MSGPFKMKGSSGLGYGNQHSEGKAPGKMMGAIAGIAGKLMGKKEEASPAPYASPAKNKNEKPKAKVTTKYNRDGSYTKSDGERSTTYKPNPNYKKGSARTGNYRFVTGETDANGNPVGE